MKYLRPAVAFILMWNLAFACFVSAQSLQASQANGKLTFSGKHVGMTFEGVFETWSAQLILPPAQSASIKAQFDMQSAKTGDATYDETLPEADWFNVDDFPYATFDSHSIESVKGGYSVSGTLTIKSIAQPVSFLLKEKESGLSADFSVSRIDFKIGTESDPDAEWVSDTINMSLTIER